MHRFIVTIERQRDGHLIIQQSIRVLGDNQVGEFVIPAFDNSNESDPYVLQIIEMQGSDYE